MEHILKIPFSTLGAIQDTNWVHLKLPVHMGPGFLLLPALVIIIYINEYLSLI